jgi:predicted amidohydrolase YtcJ
LLPENPLQHIDPNQQVKIGDLIRSYTINGAYMLRQENRIGAIKDRAALGGSMARKKVRDM